MPTCSIFDRHDIHLCNDAVAGAYNSCEMQNASHRTQEALEFNNKNAHL